VQDRGDERIFTGSVVAAPTMAAAALLALAFVPPGAADCEPSLSLTDGADSLPRPVTAGHA
jgi:hypothetical protein